MRCEYRVAFALKDAFVSSQGCLVQMDDWLEKIHTELDAASDLCVCIFPGYYVGFPQKISRLSC